MKLTLKAVSKWYISLLLAWSVFLPSPAAATALTCESIFADALAPKTFIDHFFQKSITRHRHSSSQSSSFSKTANDALLISFFQSKSIPVDRFHKYIQNLSPLQREALVKAIGKLTEIRHEEIIEGAELLTKVQLFEEAIDFYILSCQFFKAAHIMRSDLKNAERADAFLKQIGYENLGNTASKPDFEMLMDFMGRDYTNRWSLYDDPVQGMRFMKSRFPEVSETQIRQILSSYKAAMQRGELKTEGASSIAKINQLMRMTPSEVARESNVRLETILAAQAFLNSVAKTNSPKFSDKQFFVMVSNSPANSVLHGGRGFFGGPYHLGESIYIISRPEILDRNDYHATGSWGTHGSKKSDSIDAEDRNKINKFIIEFSANEKTNEIVFDNKSENLVTTDFIQEIWVHPFYRNQFLEKLKGLPPPAGRTWDSIVRGEIYRPK